MVTMNNSKFDIRLVKRVVVKVGSSLVTKGGDGIDQNTLNNWAQQIAQLRARGIQIVLVSSGAIAEGMKRLGWKVRPKAINELQAAAAVGQMGLAQAYEVAFESLHIQTAQILLTHDDLSHRTRYLNARSTIRTLLEQGVVPIINENDSVTIDEIKLGDNDTLGALVANLIEADVLIILTDQDGLYDRDPRQHANARFIHKIAASHPDLESMAGGAGSSVGTGGMYTKVLAARRAALSGAATCIASGYADNVLLHLLNGNEVGTLFTPDDNRLNARQQWLSGQLQLGGKLTIDDGAAQALTMNNSSLLSVGCIDVSGHFDRGALVSVCNQAGIEIARGLINYNDREISRLLHQPSHMIEDILGYVAEEELIHRDNMLLCRL
jgi:glutamate 5-kinase